MRDVPYSTDPQAWEFKPGHRVGGLATIEQCEEALLIIDMDRDKILAQIGEHEADPGSRAPGWRTRAEGALRWKGRMKNAVHKRARELQREAKDVSATVVSAIAAHKAAVLADEANFDDDCQPISQEAADVSMAIEIAAFQEFVLAPCATEADVQAKVHYLLNGNVGVRTPLLDCLSYEEYAPHGVDLAEAFLRSLVVAS